MSLLEVLIALAILATALVSLAQLLGVATRTNSASRAATFTATLAEQKMEQLRALSFASDAAGLPRTDLRTNTAGFPPTTGCAGATRGAGVGLAPSPPGALTSSVDGYVDYVDENGCGLGGGTTPPPGTSYVRRWSIEPLASAPDRTLVLQVLVTRRAQHRAETMSRGPEEAHLVTLRTRTMGWE